MNWKTQCAAVIPCLNEAARIGQVVLAVRHWVSTVFVIDDGSRDATSDIAKSAGAEVLRHEISRGKGTALQTGWAHASQRDFRWALTMDGDGQHSPEDIPKFFESAQRNGAELIVGNRMEKPEGMPRLRRFVNRWMSARISRMAGVPLPDSQCGFRLMNLETWATLPGSAAHFEIESDVLLAFVTQRRPIEFVPIQVIYKNEQSKIHPVRDTVRWFRWWWRAQQHVANQSSRGLEDLVEHRAPAQRDILACAFRRGAQREGLKARKMIAQGTASPRATPWVNRSKIFEP